MGVTPQESYLDSVDVSASTASSIHLSWSVKGDIMLQIQGFKVHFQQVASSYIQYSSLLPPSTTNYKIRNLVADTYYKVCIVMYRNNTSSLRECIDASTTSWHIPVSLGSSIGAILALSLIVLIVLVARCPSLIRRRKASAEAGKYDSMTSHVHEDRLEMSDTTVQVHEETFLDQDSIVVEMAPSFQPKCHRHHSDGLCNGNQNFYTSAHVHPNAHNHRQPAPKLDHLDTSHSNCHLDTNCQT